MDKVLNLDFLDFVSYKFTVTANRATISRGEHELFKELNLFNEPDQIQLMGYITKLRTYKERFGQDMPVPIRKDLLRKLIDEVKT